MKNKFEKLIVLINRFEKIGIITHVDGDGDAFGSSLALDRMLTQMGKQVVIYSDEEYPPEMVQLGGGELKKSQKSFDKNVELIICLDFNSAKRAVMPEIIKEALNQKIPIIVFDHHRNGDLAEVANCYYRDERASSTCEIIFELSQAMNYKIDKKAADFLLFGLETDTFSLSNPNTSEAAYTTASELIKLGAQVKPVIEAMKRRTLPSVKLIGIALKRLHLNKKYNIAATYVTKKDVEELGLDEKTVNSGLANYLDQIKEAGNIIVFAETEEGIKVSMRSNRSGANVGELAEFMGGGGHKLAAGFNFLGSIDEIQNS